jgi:acyl-coenzyme A thioesterase PaaI-like protein
MQELIAEPDLGPDEGWARLMNEPWQRLGPSFVSGEPSGDRLRVKYYRREADDMLVVKAWFGPGTEGPPGFAHGGSMAALMDEVMGAAAWVAGHPCLAGQIKISFRKVLPLGTVARAEGWIEELKGRKVFVRSRLTGDQGELHCEGEGLFLKVKEGQLGDFATE